LATVSPRHHRRLAKGAREGRQQTPPKQIRKVLLQLYYNLHPQNALALQNKSFQLFLLSRSIRHFLHYCSRTSANCLRIPVVSDGGGNPPKCPWTPTRVQPSKLTPGKALNTVVIKNKGSRTVLRHQEQRQRRSSRTETMSVSRRVGCTHCSCCKRCPGAGAMDDNEGMESPPPPLHLETNQRNRMDQEAPESDNHNRIPEEEEEEDVETQEKEVKEEGSNVVNSSTTLILRETTIRSSPTT